MTKNTELLNKLFEGIKPQNRYGTAKLSDFDNKELADYCREWIRKIQTMPAPFITGNVGVGKTHFLYALSFDLINIYPSIKNEIDYRRKAQVDLISSPNLIESIRNGIATNTSEEILEKYKQIPILLLDDLGSERVTEWVRLQLYLIIDYRWIYCLPVVITSNYPISGLQDKLGERIVSRIAGMCKPFLLTGADRRVG